jgi:hypothetical protein
MQGQMPPPQQQQQYIAPVQQHQQQPAAWAAYFQAGAYTRPLFSST